MEINGRQIGPGHSPYIIGELSCNHCGSLEKALALIEAAKNCGADAVKFQAYTAETITLDCDKPDFVIQDGLWKGRKLHELYTKTHTPFDWFPKLFARARELDITAFSSVFDKTSIDMLEKLGCPAYKIASMEIVDTPLIAYAAKTGKPIIISTGMASRKEIEAAHETLMLTRENPNPSVFLHCVSGYPTIAANYDLLGIKRIRNWLWRDPIMGISDHTLGVEIPVAATALGACIIEKHLMLGDEDTEDFDFSTTPLDFKEMVGAVRNTWLAMQPPKQDVEASSRQMRRSLYVVADMKAGDTFTYENLKSIRPGYGLPPSEITNILGKKATQDIERGTAMRADLWQ